MCCEICECTIDVLDRHHIQSRKYGGSNKSSNIVNLCPNCHREVHLGLIIIEGRFATTGGSNLIFHRKGEESITGFAPPVHVYERKK